jgi:hypothetical protein
MGERTREVPSPEAERGRRSAAYLARSHMETDPPDERPPGADSSTLSTQYFTQPLQSPPGSILMRHGSAFRSARFLLTRDARRAGRSSTAHERHDTCTRHTHMDMDMVCIIKTCPSDEGRADGHLAAGWARGRPRPHQAHRSSGAAAVARRRAARARTASAATAASTAAAT